MNESITICGTCGSTSDAGFVVVCHPCKNLIQHTNNAKKIKQITGILNRQLRASGKVHAINEVLNKD